MSHACAYDGTIGMINECGFDFICKPKYTHLKILYAEDMLKLNFMLSYLAALCGCVANILVNKV